MTTALPFLRRAALAAFMLVVAAPWAQAAEVPASVRHVLDIMIARWDGKEPENLDYFDGQNLEELYSRAFIADFHANEKYPAYDDGSTNPFDYDVLTDSQDGCPIVGLKTVVGPPKDGVTDIKATFHLWVCEGASEESKNKLNELHFRVVEEGGKSVIDDIIRGSDPAKGSLRKEMQQNIVAGQQ